jgi:hypothetical protein
MSEFNLDREVSIEKNVDALGKKWVIHINRQNGLCYARPEPDRSDAVIPKQMKGLWTKPALLETRIKAYLKATWDKAEVAQAEAAKKAQVAKEAKKKVDVKRAAND